jgi:hypothetical protein
VLRLADPDHDSPAIRGVMLSPNPMAALEPIEHRRDGTRSQANSLRQFPRGHRPQPADEIHTLSISTVHSQVVGNRLVHKVELAIQGSDFLKRLFDQLLLRVAV